MGRAWFSPPGRNIYTSIVLRPPPAEWICALTMTMGVAVAESVGRFLSVPVSLDWPNDLVAEGGKLAGILTESASMGERLEFVIVGIGIDVNGDDFPPGIAATSMERLEGKRFDRTAILEVLYPTVEMWYKDFIAGALEKIAGAWHSKSDIFGREVTVSEPGGAPVRGIAREITEEGALVVETEAGLEIVRSGDVRRVD